MPEVPDKQRREKFVLSVAYSPGEGCGRLTYWNGTHSLACFSVQPAFESRGSSPTPQTAGG